MHEQQIDDRSRHLAEQLLGKIQLQQQTEIDQSTRGTDSALWSMLEESENLRSLLEHVDNTVSPSAENKSIVFQITHTDKNPDNIWPWNLTRYTAQATNINNIYALCIACGRSWGPLDASEIVSILHKFPRPKSWGPPEETGEQ